MASSLGDAILTVTVSESIKLNNKNLGSTNSYSIDSITNVSTSFITCTTAAEVAILGVAATVSTDLGKSYLAGQFDEDSVRYIRITNKDTANYVLLTMRTSGDSGAQEVAIKLDKGCSLIYPMDVDAGSEATIWGSASAISAAAGSTIYNLIDIVGIANGDDVELEVFVASVTPA